MLGDVPEKGPISAVLVEEQDRGAYILEILTLDLNGIEPVPAYFARPKAAVGPRPTILYNHWYGGSKSMITDANSGHHAPQYADLLTGMGCNVLCIDAWNYGERAGRTESSLFKEMLWKGQVLWGMMVYDSLRAVDYLCSRDDVDAAKLGTIGMSMGSTMAWWVAALDERIGNCIEICCLTDFDALIEARMLDGHAIYYYVQGLLKEWTTSKINALIAPRPHLSLAGDYDGLTPVKGLEKLDADLKAVYAAEGAPEAWKLIRYSCGHMETHAMRQEIIHWLKEWLG